MNWLLIGVIIFAIFLLLRFKEIRYKITHFLIIIVVIFLVISIFSLYLNNDLDLTSTDGIIKSGKLYLSWLGNTFKNMGKISGFAVKQDWKINVTNISGK
ncbi:MAG: hypothetical protein AABW65_02305 [Nanoarchaeota archaeon]